jgi:hypothetical protein
VQIVNCGSGGQFGKNISEIFYKQIDTIEFSKLVKKITKVFKESSEVKQRKGFLICYYRERDV